MSENTENTTGTEASAEEEEVLTYEQFLESINETHMPAEAMKIAWKTLVVFRNVALVNDDFSRAVNYSYVIADFATLIANAGEKLPSIENIETPTGETTDKVREHLGDGTPASL